MSDDDHLHDHDVEEDTTALIAAAAAAAAHAVEAVDVDVHAAVLAVEEAAHKVGVVSNDDDDGLLDDELSHKRLKTADHAAKSVAKNQSHEEALAARRMKDRNRYSQMTEEQRAAYNQKRREQYHRQNENQRHKRRERERSRYHSLDGETARSRNARRAKLERERYNKMTPQELEERNRLRRERAALKRAEREAMKNRTAKDDEDAVSALPEVEVDLPEESHAEYLVEDVV